MPTRKRRRPHKTPQQRARRCAAALFLLLVCLLCCRKKAEGPAPTPTALPAFEVQAVPSGVCAATQLYLYGTHLGLCGQLPVGETFPDKLTLLWDCGVRQTVWPLQYAQSDEASVTVFSLSDDLNGGADLEALPEDSGTLTVCAEYADGSRRDWPLQAAPCCAGDLPFCYYTVTHGGMNRRITLTTEKGLFTGESLRLQCAAAALPEDVYDIILDAGHGGADCGCLSPDGRYRESDLTLSVTLLLKARLEQLGLKVGLTRDGSEAADAPMARTTYDEDGRINRIGASHAKLCLSVHCNSYAGSDAPGGVQIYLPTAVEPSFAALLAQKIADTAGTVLSPMAGFRVTDGVYCRTFSAADIIAVGEDAQRLGYDPYPVSESTNYYYILRETGGRVTGAFMDGRSPAFGVNRYYDSGVGVETYLCELGYLSAEDDLQRLLTAPESYADGMAAAIAARFGLDS